ncbi:HNH endonuclease signature motif containing protein [Salsipaludibacter albus]|uniref:HNH endonuclease signature motif containing protein n=1 Tax=Salsipaludibacter albus TaxID=2849650 RepID=UPI001EE495AF|nr:HNH endonuclease signature motif containing protein [Salsipaludibacter albus]MBY5162134.1 HNH endonuclease [Salsipaludibacter albus]
MSATLDTPVSGPPRPDGHTVTAPGRAGVLDDGMEVVGGDAAAGRAVVAPDRRDATVDDASGRGVTVPACEEATRDDTARRDVVVAGAGDGTGHDVEAEIRALVDRLARLLDGTRAPSTAAAARGRVQVLRRLTGLADAATAEAVDVLRRAGGVEADGASSTAEWVRANTGRSGRDAARVARLATDLADLPATRDALANGRITDESADAIARAARDGRLGSPGDVDARLAPVATASSPEALRADIRDRQQAVDAAAMLRDETRQHAVRDVRLWREDTGLWQLHGQLPDELGQSFRTALDAFEEADPDGTPHEQRRRPGQRLADALAAMTGAVLDRGLAPGTGGVTRPHLSVIVHADTVSAGLADPDAADPDHHAAAPAEDDPRWADLPAGELPWGGKLSPQAVRRTFCDAAVSRIVMAGDSQVLDVGRATRNWSGPQRRAVNARDRGCRGPNCSLPIAWTQVHHLQWWRHDGPTAVDNGLALCHRCHRLVHDHGWTIDFDPASALATWHSPTGATLVTRPHRVGARPDALPSGSSPPVEDHAMRPDDDPRGDPTGPPGEARARSSTVPIESTAPAPISPRPPPTDGSARDPSAHDPPRGTTDGPSADPTTDGSTRHSSPTQPRLDLLSGGGAGGIPRS